MLFITRAGLGRIANHLDRHTSSEIDSCADALRTLGTVGGWGRSHGSFECREPIGSKGKLPFYAWCTDAPRALGHDRARRICEAKNAMGSAEHPQDPFWVAWRSEIYNGAVRVVL